MERDYNKALDYILTRMAEHQNNFWKATAEERIKIEYNGVPIKESVLNGLKEMGVLFWENEILFEQLIKDGMIKDNSCENLSLKGADFILNQKGYHQKFLNDNAENIRKGKMDTRIRRYTLWMAVGTIGLLIYQIHKDYPLFPLFWLYDN